LTLGGKKLTVADVSANVDSVTMQHQNVYPESTQPRRPMKIFIQHQKNFKTSPFSQPDITALCHITT